MSTRRDETPSVQPHGHPAPDNHATDPGQRGDGFPVTIVRSALVRMPKLSPVQRRRRARATSFAESMAEAACEARPFHRHGYDYSVTDFPHTCAVHGRSDLGVAAIPQQALALVADPAPGALTFCRTEVGRITAISLHGPTWSLVLRPRATPPLLWIYLDTYSGRLGHIVQPSDTDAVDWTAVADALATAAQITPTRAASHSMPRLSGKRL